MTFKRIKKGWGFLRFFLLTRKRIWRWPSQSELLIFDGTGQEVLLKYLRPWAPTVLHLRGEQLHMPVLFFSLFRRGKRANAYVDCFIERVRPRLVVTFIDNSPQFYAIAVRHPNIKTLFIQNGYRGYHLDAFEALDQMRLSPSHFKVDYMMTLGNRIGAEYVKYIQGSVVSMGSLKNNFYSKRLTKRPDTIAFISQFRTNGPGFTIGRKYYSHQEYFDPANRLVLIFLLKYAKTHEKQVFIIPCCGHLNDGRAEEEIAYFNDLVGQPLTFSEWSHAGSSYDATDSAEVVIGLDGTLGYESAARGNKTAIFTLRAGMYGIRGLNFGWPGTYPNEGSFWSNLPENATLERILDHLFAISDEQWRAEMSKIAFSEILAYDPGNTILQSVLRRELGPAPDPGAASLYAATT
jgi:hypothetical protein